MNIDKKTELEWFECLPFKEKVLVRVQVFSLFLYKLKNTKLKKKASYSNLIKNK